MAKSPEEQAATMIENLRLKTGKSLDEWITVVNRQGLDKHRAILNYLKGEHEMTHGYANLVAMKVLQTDAGSAANTDDLIDGQYSGAKADLRPIYEKLQAAIDGFGDDVDIAPKKAYVSLRRNKQFAIIQPSTKTRVDVGLNLKGEDATARLEESGSFNSMVSHRVRLSAVDEVDDELIDWLKEAYDRG